MTDKESNMAFLRNEYDKAKLVRGIYLKLRRKAEMEVERAKYQHEKAEAVLQDIKNKIADIMKEGVE